MRIKKYNKFLNENYTEEDFTFISELKSSDIYMSNNGDEYDDFNILDAKVYWKIEFEWLGDAGINYNIYVSKVIVNFESITYIGEEEREEIEEKEIIINDIDKIEIDYESKSENFNQISVREIDVEGDSVRVEF